MRKRIYMDHAATTPVDPRVARVMEPYFGAMFGNPSSIHADGLSAKKALDQSRALTARSLGVRSDEIIFTSGGTEANNLALFGAVEAARSGGVPYSEIHIVSNPIEHSSVLAALSELERRGVSVTYVPVSREGLVLARDVGEALTEKTVLVSIMLANNEIGTIQPVREISKVIRAFAEKFGERSKKPLFHTDACQAPLYLDADPNHLGVDLLALDAHKMYGPKGVGALYVRRGTALRPLLFGGGQERGVRPTTENIPGIAGLAEALRLACSLRKKEADRLAALRDLFFKRISDVFPAAAVNGGRENRLPNNINFSLPGIDAEFLVLELDAEGIACSTKSSCLKDDPESYVVRALGFSGDRARTALRFTLGRSTKRSDIDLAVRTLARCLKKR